MSSLSPEQIEAITKLLIAVDKQCATPKTNSNWFQPDLLVAWAQMAGAIAWPLAALIAIIYYSRPIATFLSEVEHAKGPGFELTRRKLSEQMLASAREAEKRTGKSEAPTSDELRRSQTVADIAQSSNMEIVQQEAEKLARDYETIRASMAAGDARTRRMEVIMSKMRTLGAAIFPLRHRYMQSASPGERLLAIAAMEVKVDFESLDWLAERIGIEKPFVGYHAAVALNQAARSSLASDYADILRTSTKLALDATSKLPNDSDRARVLSDLKAIVEKLPP